MMFSRATIEKFFRPSIARMMDNQDIDGLLEALKSTDEEQQVDAARALGQLYATRAVMPLCKALLRGHVRLRIIAAKALGAIGDIAALDPLTAALVNDQDSMVRCHAAEALGKLGDPRSVEVLCEAMIGGDGRLRQSAIWALKRLNFPLINTRNTWDISLADSEDAEVATEREF